MPSNRPTNYCYIHRRTYLSDYGCSLCKKRLEHPVLDHHFPYIDDKEGFAEYISIPLGIYLSKNDTVSSDDVGDEILKRVSECGRKPQTAGAAFARYRKFGYIVRGESVVSRRLIHNRNAITVWHITELGKKMLR